MKRAIVRENERKERCAAYGTVVKRIVPSCNISCNNAVRLVTSRRVVCVRVCVRVRVYVWGRAGDNKIL